MDLLIPGCTQSATSRLLAHVRGHGTCCLRLGIYDSTAICSCWWCDAKQMCRFSLSEILVFTVTVLWLIQHQLEVMRKWIPAIPRQEFHRTQNTRVSDLTNWRGCIVREMQDFFWCSRIRFQATLHHMGIATYTEVKISPRWWDKDNYFFANWENFQGTNWTDLENVFYYCIMCDRLHCLIKSAFPF